MQAINMTATSSRGQARPQRALMGLNSAQFAVGAPMSPAHFGLPTSVPVPVRGASVVAHGFGFGFGKKDSGPKTCDCGSKLPYEECCEPYHKGAKLPETAEKLMRSRYTAYCRSLVDYICDTTHPSNPSFNGSTSADGKVKTTLKADVTATCRTTSFQKLKVTSTEPGSNDDEAYVSFKAEFKFVGQKGDRQAGSKSMTLEERSRFIRENGKWFYIDGKNNWDYHTYGNPDKLKEAVGEALKAAKKGN